MELSIGKKDVAVAFIKEEIDVLNKRFDEIEKKISDIQTDLNIYKPISGVWGIRKWFKMSDVLMALLNHLGLEPTRERAKPEKIMVKEKGTD